MSVRGRLESVRDDHRARRFAMAAGAAVGLPAATVHWTGLVLGGALVGLFAPTTRRALAYAFAFGLVALGAFALRLAAAGTLSGVAAMRPPVYLAVAVALAAPTLGGLVRGIA